MHWASIAILALLTANPSPDPASSTASSARIAQHPGKSAPEASLPNEDPAAEKEMLQMVNASRTKAGLAALRLEPSLSVAARAHAAFMVKSGQLEHQLPGEAALIDRVGQVTVIELDRVGENIAEDSCIEHAHEALMKSP